MEEHVSAAIMRLEHEFWAAHGLGHPNLLLIGRVPYGHLDMHCKGMTVVLADHPAPLNTYRGMTVVPVLDDHYLAVAKGVAP